MGELPSTARPRPTLLRWAVPAVILVILIAAGIYEYRRETRKAPAADSTPATRTNTNAPAAEQGTPLPNPLAATALDTYTDAGGGAASARTDAPRAAGSGSETTTIAPITLALRGSSWIEIRDSTGQAVLSQTVPAGQSQTVLGTPPFDVVIGNAREVTLNFRGRALDLAPHTRQNVARVTLR
jgi:cytoskeleton protein RodZ